MEEIITTQRGINPKSLANLRMFQPGQSGNPTGKRKSAGWTIREHMNSLQDLGRDDLIRILRDPGSSVAKIAAARAWLHASSEDLNAVGTPIAGPDLDRIFDRTEGKAKQSIELSGPDNGPIQTQQVDLSKLSVDDLCKLRELRAKLKSGSDN